MAHGSLLNMDDLLYPATCFLDRVYINMVCILCIYIYIHYMSHLWFKKMKCESTHPGTFPSWAVHFSPHFHQDIWSTLGGLVRNLQKCCIRDTWGMFTAYGSPQCRNPDSRKISCWILMKTLFGRQRQLTTSKIIRHVIKHGKMCLRLFGFDWKRLTTGWTKGSHPCENLLFGKLLPSSTAGAGQIDFHPCSSR